MSLNYGPYKPAGNVKTNTLTNYYQKMDLPNPNPTIPRRKETVWRCDFCEILIFQSYDDAYKHEKICALGLRKKIINLEKNLSDREDELKKTQMELERVEAANLLFKKDPENIELPFSLRQPSVSSDLSPLSKVSYDRRVCHDTDSENEEPSPLKFKFLAPSAMNKPGEDIPSEFSGGLAWS